MTDQPSQPQGPTLSQPAQIPAIEKLQKFLQDEKIVLTITDMGISKADNGSIIISKPMQIMATYTE